MYSIPEHARMLADGVRLDAYFDALRKSVTAHSVVVDIGTGTGIFAMLACRFGARKVYAIDPAPAIHLARTVAAANQLAGRIEFIQADSRDVVLPERASVVVSDIRGVLPLFGRHIPSIVDARRRMLGEKGVLIPRRDRLWAALVDAPEAFADHVAPWGASTCGLDLRAVREMLSNTWRRVRLQAGDLLSGPRCISVLDYESVHDADLELEQTWAADRPGTAHGFCVWFDTELTRETGFSNAPGRAGSLYGQAFFPFAEPFTLEAGDAIRVRLRADLVGDEYIWRWTAGMGGSHPQPGPTMRHSSLDGVPLGAAELRKSTPDHVPTLAQQGEIDLHILTAMHDGTPLGQIADDLVSRFPAAFPDWKAALGRTGELSRRYAK